MTASKLKILIVEDNMMNKILFREILSLKGYEIFEASSGTEAVRAAAQFKPDLILMDIQLPEMDGVNAMRLIKSDDKNIGLPVLALTASAMKGEEETILGKGFDGYIAKPIEVKGLLETVGRYAAAIKGHK